MAVFIGDYFARGSKRSGAWCSAMRSQKKLGGEVRPIVVNVCNFFAKGTAGAVVLRRRAHAVSRVRPRAAPDAVGRDLWLDLGHRAWRGISWNCRASFTNTGWRCRRCWRSTPPMPRRARRCPRTCWTGCWRRATYDMGFQTVEYVASALVDLAFHDGPRPPTRWRGRRGRWPDRHAARDRDAPRDAAFRACLRRRRLFQRATTATCGPR
jgi:peptidyl-dipeptidase Dcp